MKILILNTHSTLNSGDTGIVLATVRLLRNVWPRAAISLTSRTPALDRPFYTSRGVEVHPPFTPAPGVFSGKRRKFAGSAANLADLGAKRRLLAAIRKSDLIVSNGGGYFYSYGKRLPGPTFLQHWFHLRLARAWERPVIFFPQSFGPFANPPAACLCRSILEGENVRNIFVRENISRDLVLELLGEGGRDRVTLCPDPVFLLEPTPSTRVEDFISSLARPVLALTLRDWHFPEASSPGGKQAARERYLGAMLEVSSTFREQTGGTVMVVNQVRGPDPLEDDTRISREFFRRIAPGAGRGKTVSPPSGILESPDEVITLFSRADLILATRFHSAVFALLGGTPAVTVGYQHKAAGMLRELGLERFLVEISRVSPPKVWSLIEELLADPARWRNRVAAAAGSARELARERLSAALGQFPGRIRGGTCR